jgi:uncharacterized protein YdhG (YjbR/CyaY superfamily)
VTPIDAYLEKVEPSKRRALTRIRAIALERVPGAQEAIVYGMPTLKFQGKPFLGFDARKNHIGLYPYSSGVITALKDHLGGYETSRGAIRVPLDVPIPKTVLRKVIDCRLRAIPAEIKTKAGRSGGAVPD